MLGPDTPDELAECRNEARGDVVLPGFGELLFGDLDGSPSLDADLSNAVFGRNAVGASTVLLAGQVVATWRLAPRRSTEVIEISELVPLSKQVLRSAGRKAVALSADRT